MSGLEALFFSQLLQLIHGKFCSFVKKSAFLIIFQHLTVIMLNGREEFEQKGVAIYLQLNVFPFILFLHKLHWTILQL